VAAILWPEHVAEREREDDWRRTAFENFLLYGHSFAAFIGASFVIYQGVATVLDWIPGTWMRIFVREIERESTITVIAMLTGFFGALGLVTGLSKLSNQIVREQIEVERLRDALQEARQQPK
jgi:hypothetical protein